MKRISKTYETMKNSTLLQKDKVLIIEDDTAIRESLQDILELKGYEAITAINGKEGLVAVIKEKPTIVICDVNMPQMGGFEMLKALNECMDKELVPPFLFLTARTTTEDIRKGMELGADDYITKPFNPTELLEIINAKIIKRKKILSLAVVEEQHRISSELHDGIQQLLIASQMGFKAIREEVEKLDYDTQKIFERSLDFLKEATKDIRNISHEILEREPIDLKAKIDVLLLQLKEAGEIETHFFYQLPPEFGNDKKIELLRIIQEAINNIIKYSSAKNLFLQLVPLANKWKLEIKDDGRGFDSSKVQQGNGIINMKNRAEKIGASFSLVSEINKGTTINLLF
ncbi:MAG: hypothetical protein COX70_02330 [Flavobacteriales bacterium CG_4_10_14_0_2_um_filter_32_8]|nr:MAG: hypothetical protein COX70_02330 [Flavobacteriales bacterium CG_4_10_14_0_2_um_filter_32_8]